MTKRAPEVPPIFDLEKSYTKRNFTHKGARRRRRRRRQRIWQVATMSSTTLFLIYVQITFPPSLLPSRLSLLEPVAATTANKVQSHGLRIAPAGGLEVHALIVPALRAFHLPSLRQSRIRRDVGDDRRLLAKRVLHLVPINQARRRVLDVVAVLALKLEPLLVLVLERVEDLLCVRTTRARTERERVRERVRETRVSPSCVSVAHVSVPKRHSRSRTAGRTSSWPWRL